jgi:hypothetical protein
MQPMNSAAACLRPGLTASSVPTAREASCGAGFRVNSDFHHNALLAPPHRVLWNRSAGTFNSVSLMSLRRRRSFASTIEKFTRLQLTSHVTRNIGRQRKPTYQNRSNRILTREGAAGTWSFRVFRPIRGTQRTPV